MTRKVREAAPKLVSTFVITLLIASIIPLSMLSINPSVIPKAAASPNIIFQDGFETASPGNWDWISAATGGTITYGATDAYKEGSKSFKFASTSSSGYGYARGGSTSFGYISDTMWMQMYVRINPYPHTTDQKVEFFEILNSGANVIAAIRLYQGSNGKEMLELKAYYPTPATLTYSGNLNLQSNGWYKIEFKMYRHSTQGEYRVYIEGMNVITLKNINTSGSNTVPASLRVGVPYSSNVDTNWTVWVDDVKVSNTTRIGTAYTGAVFKDGFEKGVYENWDSSSTSSGTFSNDTNVKVEGTQSLKFAATSTTGYGYYSGSENFTNLSNDLWMQMYVRIDKYPHDAYDKVEFFELRSSTGAIAGLRFYMGQNGKEMIELKRYLPSATYNYSTPLNIKNNTWQQIEFRQYRDSTAGEYRVYLNGSEIITITGLDTSGSATEPARMRVGAPYADNSYSSWNIWVDDVKVSDSRVSVAGPQNCGIEQTGSGFIYAYGKNNNTVDYYLKYGLKGKSLVTNPYICGTFQSDGSVGGAMIVASQINGLWIELGWFKGNYTTYGLVAQSTPHYFRGYQQSGGALIYTDISTLQNPDVYPVVNHWATFTLNGDPTGFAYYWNSTIESDDHSTIVVTQASLTNSSSTQTYVMLETHNTMSSGTAHFKDLQNAKNVSRTLSWVNWGESYPDKSISGYPPSYDPLESYKMSVNQYCMYTDPQEACP